MNIPNDIESNIKKRTSDSIKIEYDILMYNLRDDLMKNKIFPSIKDDVYYAYKWRARWLHIENRMRILVILLTSMSSGMAFVASYTDTKTFSFISGMIGIITFVFINMTSHARKQFENKTIDINKYLEKLNIDFEMPMLDHKKLNGSINQTNNMRLEDDNEASFEANGYRSLENFNTTQYKEINNFSQSNENDYNTINNSIMHNPLNNHNTIEINNLPQLNESMTINNLPTENIIINPCNSPINIQPAIIVTEDTVNVSFDDIANDINHLNNSPIN
jgi:hypothetical protein